MAANNPQGEEIAAAILALLKSPKSYTIDGENIQSQSIADAIKAADWIRQNKGDKAPWRALSKCRISTQGPERH